MRRLTIPLLSLVLSLTACDRSPVTDVAAHRAAIEQWHAKRVARLTSETGWLTLVGLYWLKPGENTFGRAPSNALVLDHAALPDTLGSFIVTDGKALFTARAGAGVTHDGAPVTSLALLPDTAKDGPTVLAAGTLQFYTIERAGHLGVRVRDTQHPARTEFKGIDSFPIDPDWVVDARFIAYDPPHILKILNILGMVDDTVSPGALEFRRGFSTYRIDTVLESPEDEQLFIMFADATSGHETYGAGRFMYVDKPKDGHVILDFNEAYNPPCAFNDFATCPLPPPQNRIALRVTAGEKVYARPR